MRQWLTGQLHRWRQRLRNRGKGWLLQMGVDAVISEVDENKLIECLKVIHLSFRTVADEFGLNSENCPTNGAFMPIEKLESDFSKGSLMFVICEDEKVVAFMQCSKSGSDTIEMEKLAVLPQHRHKGYGKNLIAFAKQKSKELGAAKITIGIIEENIRLKNWYASNGFIHKGTRIFPHLPFTVGFMECPLY